MVVIIREWLLYLTTAGRVSLALSSDGSGDASGDSDDTMVHNNMGNPSGEGGQYTLSDTKWHHVLVSYNGAPSQAVNWVFDGVVMGSVNDGQLDSDFEEINQDNAKVYMGAYLAGSMGYHMIGYIADPIYLNRLVAGGPTAKYMYNKGKPRNLSRYEGYTETAQHTEAYWQMGDGTEKATGSTVYDMSGLPQLDNGTLTNGAAFKNESPGIGRDSYSFVFDGTNGYVELQSKLGISEDDAWSFSCWFKGTKTESGSDSWHKCIIWAENGTSDFSNKMRIGINNNASGTPIGGIFTQIIEQGLLKE